MSVFDIFKGGTNAAPAQPTPQQPTPVEPGNIPPPTNPAAPGQGHVPAADAEAARQAAEENSPLAQFEKLWEPVTTEGGNDSQQPPAELTAEDVQKAVAKANFSQSISPEQLQAISQGGEGAQKAFADALNSVAQQVMVQATLVNNKLTEKAVTSAIERERSNLPSLVREQATNASLTENNPIFSSPAVKPVVEATKQQLLQKYPNASPAEITQMTKDYILAMGEAFSPKAPDLEPGETDWSTFL